MKPASCILFATIILCSISFCLCGIVKDLLRNNIAGPLVIFQQQSWPIDPEAGLRWRKEYISMNGLYGNDRVASLGLGEDGRMEERRIQQGIRDSTGALSYEVPP